MSECLWVVSVSEGTSGVAVVCGVEKVKVELATGDQFKFMVVRAGERVETTSAFKEYQKSAQKQNDTMTLRHH